EPSFNQNYDGNYYSHDLPSSSCCDYYGESHENFQCQPDNQNVDFSGSDQIQTPQYLDVHENPLTNDEFEAYTISNNANMNDLQFKLDKFQKNQQDFQEKYEQMQDDLLNQMRNFMQNFQNEPPGEDKEHEATTDTELSSTEDIQPLLKHNMEKTMLDLVKICHHKQFFCIHDDIEDLIENALDSKLLSINSINSQRLDKKEQEVKIVEEQSAERGNHKMECDELIYENSSTIDVCDSHSEILFDSNNDDLSSDDESFKDIEYVDVSVLDPAIVSIEEENVVQQKEEEERLINLVENDILDNSSNDPLLEEVDLFLSDHLIPPGIENVVDDPEGDIRFLEELLINDSILSHESSDSNFKDNSSISRPPPEFPDDNFDLEPEVISAVMEDIDEPDEHF
nr:hypothetical protein [Tanacetum cinerariifolium]